MIFIKVFQELNILIPILGDKELKNTELDYTFVEWGTKNESTAELGRGEQGQGMSV